MDQHDHKPDPICTAEEVERILEVAARSGQASLHPEDAMQALKRRTILEVLFGTGIRSIELVNLQPCDIEWPTQGNGEACYLHLAVTKGGRRRTVPITPRVHEWLERWCEATEKWRQANCVTADFLFHQVDKRVFGKHLDKPMTTRNIRKLVERAAVEALGEEAAGRISPHTCRRFYITNAFKRGVPLMFVQKLAGHRSPATTSLYTMPDKRDLYDAMCETG